MASLPKSQETVAKMNAIALRKYADLLNINLSAETLRQHYAIFQRIQFSIASCEHDILRTRSRSRNG